MYIEGASALQTVDDVTHISVAQLVEPLTSLPVWESVPTFRTTVYNGLPNTLVLMMNHNSEILL